MVRAVFLALVFASSVHAQEVDTDAGRDLYMTYCWQCHGLNAEGNGPMAEMLAIQTPNLTRIAERNNGEFPTAVVAAKIDGRSPLLAHGGEMPIFGPALEADQHVVLSLKSGQPMMTALPLANVVVYLESIQAE
jgi:mono/diheme cytochrome c family protein